MIYKKVFISVSHSHSILCIPKRKLRIFYCYCLSFVLYYRFHSGNNYVNFAHPCVCVCSVAQSCSTLCDPMNCSPPGSSVHGVSQPGILEWVAICYSQGPFKPGEWTYVSCMSSIGRQILCNWATWEVYSPLYPQKLPWSVGKFGALQNIHCFNTFMKNQYKHNNFWQGPLHLNLKKDLWDDGLNIVPRNSLTSPLCQHYIRDHIKGDWLKLK